LTVNYAKSGLIVLGKEIDWAERAANLLRCKLVQLPITYLGGATRGKHEKILFMATCIVKDTAQISKLEGKLSFQAWQTSPY